MGDWRNVLHEHSPAQVRVTTFLNSPPPVMGGERYIVGTTPSGPFAGRPNAIATFTGTAWLFDTPEPGWRAYVSALEEEYVFHLGRWQPSILIESKGDLIIGGNSGIPERLPGNPTVGTRKFLSQYQDDPESSLLTTWEQIQYSDIVNTPDLSGYIPYSGASNDIELNAKKLENVGSLGVGGVFTDGTAYIFRQGAGAVLTQHIAVDGIGGSALNCRKSRGTLANPTVPLLNDVIGGITNLAWSGTAWRSLGSLRFYVDGDITTTSVPGRIELQVTPVSSVAPVTVGVIKNNGYFGIGTTSPNDVLHVAGNGRFDGTLKVHNPTLNKRIEITQDNLSIDFHRYDEVSYDFYSVLGIHRYYGIEWAGNPPTTAAQVQSAQIVVRKNSYWEGEGSRENTEYDFMIYNRTEETFLSRFKIGKDFVQVPYLAGSGDRYIGADTNGVLKEMASAGSNWTKVGNDIYYNTGRVSIGESNFGAALQVKAVGTTAFYAYVNGTNSVIGQFEHIGLQSVDHTNNIVNILRSSIIDDCNATGDVLHISDAPTLYGSAKVDGNQVRVKVDNRDCFVVNARSNNDGAFLFNTMGEFYTGLLKVSHNNTEIFSVNPDGSIVTGNGNSSFQVISVSSTDPMAAPNRWIKIKVGSNDYWVAARLI